MKKNYLLFFALLLFAGAVHAQTNEVATLLFSLDVKDVVSMYCDENAETFFLHTKTSKTDGIKYTVSREGEILAEEPSKVLWACWDDGVMYTHGLGDGVILNQYGDTIVQFNGSKLVAAKPMYRKDGVFYWWYGGIEAVSTSSGIYSFTVGDEYPQVRRLFHFYCTGVVAMDNIVLCTAYDVQGVGIYTIYYNDEKTTEWTQWEYKEPKELPGVKSPVGLSLVGDTFYIWSNDTQTMYTIPKSYFGGVTGVEAPVVDTDNESIYAIDGRPADGTRKGLYIRNGKKVLVR